MEDIAITKKESIQDINKRDKEERAAEIIIQDRKDGTMEEAKVKGTSASVHIATTQIQVTRQKGALITPQIRGSRTDSRIPIDTGILTPEDQAWIFK